MVSHYNHRGEKKFLIKYYDNIMIYHFITRERGNCYLMKYE